LLDGEEGTTGQVEVQRPALDVVEVRSSRASVGDMRMLLNGGKVETSRGVEKVSSTW
jgi:hypothetical protein